MRRSAIFLLFAASLWAQQKGYVAPKTSHGDPDLQGGWTNVTITPLERPAQFANKPFLTAEEARAYEKSTVETNNADRRDRPAEQDVGLAYNDFWYDRGTKAVGTLRTSLIVDPPDGKVPALTPEGQKMAQQRLALRRQMGPADGPESRSLAERCIQWPTMGPPMMPSFYNNNYQIVQGKGFVAILVEMVHDVRMVPLDGRPHLPSNIKLWFGDPRGHWEGNTLVVESTNFSDKTNFRGSSPDMKLTEKFTRVASNQLMYQFTIDDPKVYTKPWTAEVPMLRTDGPIYEYACHEGNYAMEDMLRGARVEEKKAAK